MAKRKLPRVLRYPAMPAVPDIILRPIEASLTGVIPGLRSRADVQAVIDQLVPDTKKPGAPME